MNTVTSACSNQRARARTAPSRLERGPVILGSGAYVPERVVRNDEVGAPAGVDAAWIERKTAIVERRWARPEQATSDLAVIAGRRALEAAGVRADDLTTIVVATSTPDHTQPPSAAFVQHQLGATNAAAFDLNAVCSGFLFALSTASKADAVAEGPVLVVGADVYSRITNRADRRTVILFGDGAGAVVVGAGGEEAGHHVVSTKLHSFGALTDMISVPAGGSRMPGGTAVGAEKRYFTMDGRAVREFVLSRLPALVSDFLVDNGLAPQDVQHLVPHQANGVMLEELVSRLGMSAAHVHMTVQRLGNTGAASIPITLDAASAGGGLARGDLVLLLGFGGGMSVGLALLRW